MIIYFANRKMEIIGHAHTSILSDKGNVIIDDIKTDELSTGVKSFELEIETSEKEILKLEECCTAGNYILSQPTYEKSLNFRSTPEYYTIIESEVDAINLKIRIYCEDAGLDLLNEIVGEYAADQAYNIAYYINKFAYDSGFEIGTNEIPNLTRTLSWEGESTAAERIASVATQFDNAEISFSFQMRGLKVIHKYINIHKKRGEVKNCTLLVGDHLANLTKTTSVANLATALKVTGGTPEATQEQIDADVEPEPINLVGYKYDDDDVYVGTDGNLYTRKGLATWSRYLSETGTDQGYITVPYSYDTLSQDTLFANAYGYLLKVREPEVSVEADVIQLPKEVQIGDTVQIADNITQMYFEGRVLKIETSVTQNKATVTFGEYVIEQPTVAKQLSELATQLQSVKKRQLFTWIAYADDAIGTGITLDPTGKTYMGTATNRTKAVPGLSDPSVYRWAKIQGENGEDGLRILSIVTQYCLSDSKETPAEEWSDTMPEWQTGTYLWHRLKISYSDNTVEYTNGIVDTGWEAVGTAQEETLGQANDQITMVSDQITTYISMEMDSFKSAVSETYVTVDDYAVKVGEISSSIEQMKDSITISFQEYFDQNIQTIDDKFTAVESNLAAWFDFSLEGLQIAKAGSPFASLFTNEKLSFMEGDVEVSYISNQKMYIKEAEITGRLHLGNFAFIPNSDGSLSLRKVK